MNILSEFITILLLSVGGFIAVAIAILIVMAVGVYTYKAGKLLIALLNAAIKEPEDKIVKKVRRLNDARRKRAK
jgi:hypothetical protein